MRRRKLGRESMPAAESKKRKVLIVAYDFPPAASIAALRISKFAKYLPQFGWEPVVLTRDIGERQSPNSLTEVSEANVFRVDTGTHGKLTQLLSPLSNLTLFQTWRPEHTGWYYTAVKEGHRILDRLSVDVIFSSFPPPAPHFVAAKLQQKTHIPWVAEFRDPWSFNPYSHYDVFTGAIARLIEKRTIRGSSLLVAISGGMAKVLEKLHTKKVHIIHNGFDEEDYQGAVSPLLKFTITYTGNIYRGKRDPSVLFEAVRQLYREEKLQVDDFQIRFFGSNVIRNITPLVIKYGIQDFVKVYGNIPLKESIWRQKEATVLLLLSWDNIKDKNTLPGKAFEYLGAKRPLLSIAYRNGAIDELLQMTGTGVLVTEVERMKSILCQWINEWQRSGKIISHWHPDDHIIKSYTRKESARKLAQVLEEATIKYKTMDGVIHE